MIRGAYARFPLLGPTFFRWIPLSGYRQAVRLSVSPICWNWLTSSPVFGKEKADDHRHFHPRVYRQLCRDCKANYAFGTRMVRPGTGQAIRRWGQLLQELMANPGCRFLRQRHN